MSLSTGPGSILSMVTGVLLLAMGVYIWFVAPRSRQNNALVAFTTGWGALVATTWVLTPDDPWWPFLTIVTSGLFGPVVAISAFVLAWDFGGREVARIESRRLWWVVPFACVPLIPALYLSVPPPDMDIVGWGDGLLARWVAGIMVASWSAGVAAIVILLMLAALRYPWLVRERPQAADSVLLLTFGLGTYLAVLATTPLDFPASTTDNLAATLGFAWTLAANAMPLVLAILWLRNTAKTPVPYAARARWAAWIILAVMLATLLSTYVFGTWADEGLSALEATGVLTSITRFLAIAAFTYAILRNQLLGIDVKLRWTIARSTIAAAFVVAFFVASEGAQILFGQGNEWVGLFAAAVLVFAIAPLQRAAERLAAKAVPTSTDPPQAQATLDAQESAYKAAVPFALRGGISRNEEIELARIAEVHALSPLRALQLRHEVEESYTAEAAT